VFEIVVVVAFQSAFRSEIHQNNIYIFLNLFLISANQNNPKTLKNNLKKKNNFQFWQKKKKQIKTQYQTPLGLLFLLEVKIFKGHNWVLLGKNKPIYVLIKHRPTIGNGLSYNQG